MSTAYETPHEQTPTDNFPLSIIPVSSQKIPFQQWTEFQHEKAPVDYWHSHYLNQGSVGVICGIISGNVEIIDVDVKNDPKKTIWDEYAALIPKDLLDRLIIQTTPNQGYHIIYCCPDAQIEPNQKLALHSDKSVIIETRGEGGYFCTNAINNKVLQGTFYLKNLTVDIPVITPQERNFLLETARSLTRYFPKKDDNPYKYSIPAINAFNEQYSIIELFEKHDWSVVREDDEKVYLLRDGSVASHSGYYFKDSRVFFCFSTSTDFISEKPYNHFQVLQVLEGNNDYRTTVRLLPEYGFQVEGRTQRVNSDDILDYLNGIGLRFDSFVQDLTFNDVVVDERVYNTLFVDMKKHFGREIPRANFEEVAKCTHITEVHPVRDYIEANRHRNPSGTFERWLDCLILKNPNIDKSAVLHFLKKWYVGMVAQALDGEYANEFFLTLLSVEQGIGKTTMLRKYTLPEALQKYRVEHSLSFDDDFKVVMSQSLLVIDDEMDGRTYEAEKTFKTILSNKELTTRRKYDRRISTIKRRCSFAGSGNNLSVVREQKNRRIIPIELADIDKQKLAVVDLDDLFMEAYHLFESGFKYSFEPSDIELLKQLNEDYIQQSDVDLIIDEYLDQPADKAEEFQIGSLELVSLLLSHFSQYGKRINVPSVTKQLNDRGYIKFRKGKKKITTYVVSKRSKIFTLSGSEGYHNGMYPNYINEPWHSPFNDSGNHLDDPDYLPRMRDRVKMTPTV